jgi:hypothetical protein
MTQQINYIVAKTSPGLYAAAKQAGLNTQQKNQIEQFSWTVDKNKQLNSRPVDAARMDFNNLDADVQEMLKFLYPDAEYAKDAPTTKDYAFGALKTVGKGVASPLIGLFKAAGVWNRLINTPYLMARQGTQGEGLFTKQTFTDAWDGRRVYDSGALTETIKVFGKERVEVAKGLLAGLTPGEIISSYGSIDQPLLDAISEAFSDESSFKQVLDGVKYAQVSLGRDVARSLTKTNNRAASSPHIDYISGKTKNISGWIDFAYQILIDPLTYVTAGLSKLPIVGTRLAGKYQAGQQITESIARYGTDGVREAFKKYPDLAKHWDSEIGPEVKKLSDAKTDAEKAVIRRKIGERFEGHNSDEWLDLLSRNKIFNAESAAKYFGDDTEVATKLLAGRVDGIQYFRNGIATARNQRRLDKGLSVWVGNLFNPTRPIDELEKGGKDAWDILTKVGTEGELVSPVITDLQAFRKQLSFRERKFGNLLAKTPQSRSIRIGERAIETADNFRDTARLVLPRDLADVVTFKFVNSEADEQVAVLRSLYYAVMQRYGLDGHPLGKELIEKELASHFGDREGLAVLGTLEVNPKFTDVVGKVGLKLEDNLLTYESSSIIHPFQEAQAISNLDYQLISQTVAEIKSKKNIIQSVSGATQRKFSSEFVNFWSVFTLFPRLGIRSAIDEGFFFMLTAPARDVFDVLRRKGHRMGKVATASSGSKSAEGFRESIKGGLGMTRTSESIPAAERLAIRSKLAKDKGVSVESITDLELSLATAYRAEQLFPSRLTPEDLDWFTQALAHSTHTLTGSAASITGRASLSARKNPEITEQIIGLNQYELMLKQIDNESGRAGIVLDVRDIAKAKTLGEHPISAVHFENWVRRFYGNSKDLKGTIDNVAVTRKFNPVESFFENNALETAEDFAKARNVLLQSIGVMPNARLTDEVGEVVASQIPKYTYVVDDPKAVKEFLAMSNRTAELRGRGFSDAEIARDQVERILLDLYSTFHGNATNFNSNLLSKVKSIHARISADEAADGRKISNKWGKASQQLSFDDFVVATDGFRPASGVMYSTLNIDNLNNFENAFAKLGNNMFELMDRQVTGMFRQPAVSVAYLRLRKNYAKLESEQIRKQVSVELKFAENRGLNINDPRVIDDITADVTEVVNRKFTEIALQQAADTVLKFADNASVRSNFALSVRNVGRFYRATEDFWRRIYRLENVTPRAIYRLRLIHVGMDANGDIYEDSNGEPYVMMPMDDIIFKTVEGITRGLGAGEGAFKQPLFNDFTFKLRLANPSFSPDSGMPTLSGPISALSVVTMKALLGQTGSPDLKQFGEELDNYALGTIGEGMDVVRALVPLSLQRLYAIMPVNEKSRQESTAAMQAVAYNASQGRFIDPTMSEQEKYNYLKNVRVSAHNIMVMRSVLGLISPITASTQESKDIPDYLKEVGITGLRSEFYDILNGIMKKYDGDVQDPYDLAVATFIAKNPNKLIYTVSRDERNTNVVIQKTEDMKKWFIANEKLVKTFGEAAFIFAPHTGDFDAGAYSFLEAADYIENKSLEKYYQDVLVARDKQTYFDIERDEREQLKETASITARKQIIEQATAKRNSLKLSNPLLGPALVGGGNEIASEENMFKSLEELIVNTDVKMPEATRSKLIVLSNQVRSFIDLANDPEARSVSNFTQLKRDRKEQIDQLISQFIEGDLIVKEANRAIFRAILSYYSRDTYTVFRKGF